MLCPLHNAAVLLFLEASIKLHGKGTCTQELHQWVIPAYQNDILYAPVKDLDFNSVKGKKKKMDLTLSADTPQPSHVEKHKQKQLVSEPSHSSYEKLNECFSNPAILSITLPYAYNYQPKIASACFLSLRLNYTAVTIVILTI